MATITFDIEIVNELDGSFMNFEYEYEVYDDMTTDEIEYLANELERGTDSDLYDTILSNISIVPRMIHIDGANDV